MPGEVSRPFDPCPDDDQQEPRDAIQSDTDLHRDYGSDVLIGEIRRLRGILDECWDAAGLLTSKMTHQPWQAWEQPSDLVMQIHDLWSDADADRNDDDRGGTEGDPSHGEQPRKTSARNSVDSGLTPTVNRV